jgi:catechol 1,2-dioxygenase
MPQGYTDHVINAMGPRTSPRLRKVLGSLIQHIHDFTRENQITVEEWLLGMEFINNIGKISDDRRDEAILVSDVLGMESYDHARQTNSRS